MRIRPPPGFLSVFSIRTFRFLTDIFGLTLAEIAKMTNSGGKPAEASYSIKSISFERGGPYEYEYEYECVEQAKEALMIARLITTTSKPPQYRAI